MNHFYEMLELSVRLSLRALCHCHQCRVLWRITLNHLIWSALPNSPQDLLIHPVATTGKHLWSKLIQNLLFPIKKVVFFLIVNYANETSLFLPRNKTKQKNNETDKELASHNVPVLARVRNIIDRTIILSFPWTILPCHFKSDFGRSKKITAWADVLQSDCAVWHNPLPKSHFVGGLLFHCIWQ